MRLGPQRASNATNKIGGVAFHSKQVSESEGEAGKFFDLTPQKIRQVLGNEADTLLTAYAVTRLDVCEGKHILGLVGDREQCLSLARVQQKLVEARELPVHAGPDDAM